MISGCKLVIGCESSNNSLTKTNKIAKKKKKKKQRLEGFGLTCVNPQEPVIPGHQRSKASNSREMSVIFQYLGSRGTRRVREKRQAASNQNP